MRYLGVLFCHVLLTGFVLSTLVDTKQEKKSTNEEAIQNPTKVNSTKNINKEEISDLVNVQTEKPATKKRDVPEVFATNEKPEDFDDDFYESKSIDDYDSFQALKSYLENSRAENSLSEPNRFLANNDFRLYNGDSRRKRTAIFEKLFNKPDGYYEPEIQLTPDEILALAAYRQQLPILNDRAYGRWNDVNNAVNLQESEADIDDVFNDRRENLYAKLNDPKLQNWLVFPRDEKLIFNRQRRNNFIRNPNVRVPVFRRAVL